MATGYIPIINEVERAVFEKLLSSGVMKTKHIKRLQAVLSRADGLSNQIIAKVLRTDPASVSGWIHLYKKGGIETLVQDKTRPPRIPPIELKMEQKICRITVQETPKNATHWTTRTMAKRVGLSHNKIAQIWRKYDLKPHIVKRFKKSRDVNFEAKMADVVGLYLNPPEKSIVFCVDEKSQIQALQRSQPILPLKPGSPERHTHDYYRHGTTTLFAALDVISGKIYGQCKTKHTAKDFIDFLAYLDLNTPQQMDLHIIADNYATHKTAEVKVFLNEHPRMKMHFIPTSSSWLNMIERWFAEITTKRIRRGDWHSLNELTRAIYAYLREWNKNPRTFRWTKSSSEIMKKINAFS